MNDKIIIKDHDDVLEIGFEDIKKYHGQAAIAMVAVAFKGLQAALNALSPGRPPRREDISITSGHPGPGVRDTFELVTRAVTRGAYTVDTQRPQARLNPYVDASYSFDVALGADREAKVILRNGVLPERFFELANIIRHAPDSEAEKQELVKLKRTIAEQVLARPASDLFTVSLP